jgi:predicted membrane-bound spermidine synthase
MSHAVLGRLLLGLFVLSGFAGLVYQSIWSHYLGLSLGHAAYAQTLVLAIFMGGMALGAWAVSRFGLGWRRLILAYAVVEAVIGVLGLVFHPLFVAYMDVSQQAVYPALDAAWAVRAWQWGTAALLILPQSVLLGMTFPLMSGGYLRLAPREDGEILGGLYFSNSLGAALGALAATFLLLPAWGMPGTVAFAGWLNLLVAGLAWLAARQLPASALVPQVAQPMPEPARSGGPALGLAGMMLLATFLSGAASFVYEIGWVRLLNQALGTTLHSFELMLAAFILGLAFGGLYVRRRSARIVDAVTWAGWAQVLMGLAALASLPVFANSFQWVAALMQVLPRDDAGYNLFMAGSAGIAMLVMFPAAFFAGMTLPLFTLALLRAGHGERSIGRIYAANTLGAIVGVMLAVHVLIPLIGVRLAITLAALADVLLGLVLLRSYARELRIRPLAGAIAGALVVLIYSLALGRPDPLAQVSGVYRTGDPLLDADGRVLYLRDGKTATIAVYGLSDWATISTNGKPDASLAFSERKPPASDEVTMIMAGALPLALHPNPQRVAIIGWGSGLTTHTVLGSPAPVRVDSIEIERAMVQGARQFGERVARAYRDPRSKLHIDDARTWFAAGQRRFDVIISEPSNPWVSGVAALFTREFYRLLGQHLSDEGLLIQWLQSYEIDDALMATLVAALIEEFAHVDVYLANSSDLLFVASGSPLPSLDAARLQHHPLDIELGRVGLTQAADFDARRLAGERVLSAWVHQQGAMSHSDYHPDVALNAPRSRFAQDSANFLIELRANGLPTLDLLEGRVLPGRAEQVARSGLSSLSDAHHFGLAVNDALLDPAQLPRLARADVDLAGRIAQLQRLSAGVVDAARLADWFDAAAESARHSIGLLPAQDHLGVWIDPVWIDASVQPAPVVAVLAAYAAAAGRDAQTLHRAALAALDQVPVAHPIAEQMLLLAMLGAAASGDPDAAMAIAAERGKAIESGPHYPGLRAFLLAWAELARSAGR